MDVFRTLGDIVNPISNSEELRTLAVINKISGMCCGCNEQHDISKMDRRRYLHPYQKVVVSGLFCKDCQNDSDIKKILR